MTNNPPQLSWRYRFLAAAIILASIAMFHGGDIVKNFFQLQWEDGLFFEYTKNNIHSLWDCFTKLSVWPGLYRPLTTNCYYYLGMLLFDNKIEFYHSINLFFYFANAFLFFLISAKFLPPNWAIVSAALFASRLSHYCVVNFTCEFQALLSVFFSMIAILLFMRGRHSGKKSSYVFSSIALSLAILSKETAVFVPFIMAVYYWLFDNRKEWKPYLAQIGVAILWMGLYAVFLEAIKAGDTSTGFKYVTSIPELFAHYKFYLMGFPNTVMWDVYHDFQPAKVSASASSSAMSWVFAFLCLLSGYTTLMARQRSQIGSFQSINFGFIFFMIATFPYALLNGKLYLRYGYLGNAGLSLCCAAVMYKIVVLVRNAYSRRLNRTTSVRT